MLSPAYAFSGLCFLRLMLRFLVYETFTPALTDSVEFSFTLVEGAEADKETKVRKCYKTK